MTSTILEVQSVILHCWPKVHLWCTSTKQGSSCTSLFWDMGNRSWHRMKNNSSIDFEIFFFLLCTLICLLSPPCNFLLIFKHFPIKNCALSAACQIKNYRIGNFKGWFLKITFPEKLLTVSYINVHVSRRRSMNLILVSN